MDFTKGGRGRKAPYSSVVCRIPSPIKPLVDGMVEAFYDLVASDKFKEYEDTTELWIKLSKDKTCNENNAIDKKEAMEEGRKILRSKKGNKKQQFEKLLQVIYGDVDIDLSED